MIAAVVDTPYQLISALRAAGEVAPGECIVFFMNTYLYFKERKFDYSDGHPLVHSILYYGKKHMGAAGLAFGLMNPASMLNRIDGFEHGLNIDAIITSRTTYIATYIYNYYAKKGKRLPVYLIEEGIGEYTGGMVSTRFTGMLNKLGQKTHMDRVTAAYFSAPSLYPYKTPFPIKKIPAFTDETRAIALSIFGGEKLAEATASLAPYRFLFLSEPNSCEMTNPGDATEYDRAEDAITDAALSASGGDMIIKAHPLYPEFKKEGANVFYSTLPMEALLMSIPVNEKVFISSMSTAMLTPKLLFGAEPALVFTYKILDPLLKKFLTDDAQRQRYYDFINGVMDMYENKGRCFAPQTIEEFTEVVRGLK